MEFVLNIVLHFFIFLAQQHSINPGQYRYVASFNPDKCQIDTVYEKNGQLSIDTIPEYKFKLDLNGDKYSELFIADGCGKGLCGWKIIDGKTKRNLGFIEAWFVYVTDTKTNGYPILETYSKDGCCNLTVTLHRYTGKIYSSVGTVDLVGDKLENYIKIMNDWDQKLDGVKN